MFKSKTVWLGIALATIPLLQALQALPLTPLTAQVLSIILGGLVVLNRLYGSVTPVGNSVA